MSKIFKYFLPVFYVFVIFLNVTTTVNSYGEHRYLAAAISFICTVVAIGAFHYFLKTIFRRKEAQCSADNTSVFITVRFAAPGRREKILLSHIRTRAKGSECLVTMRRMAAPMAMHSLAMTLASMAEKEGVGEEFNELLPQILDCAELIRKKQIEEAPRDAAKTE